jgi:ABC-type sugar transport system permease subunit
LNNIPADYYEAAKIDGASTWQSFRAITWPLLRPTTLFCLILSVIGAFQIFGQSYVLFGDSGGPGRAAMTLAVYMYQQGFSEFEIGYGNAVAYLLFLILMIVSAVQFGLLSRREDQ